MLEVESFAKQKLNGFLGTGSIKMVNNAIERIDIARALSVPLI